MESASGVYFGTSRRKLSLAGLGFVWARRSGQLVVTGAYKEFILTLNSNLTQLAKKTLTGVSR